MKFVDFSDLKIEGVFIIAEEDSGFVRDDKSMLFQKISKTSARIKSEGFDETPVRFGPNVKTIGIAP